MRGGIPVKLFMDDQRRFPIGWMGVRTVEEAQLILNHPFFVVTDASFDHDMGACEACVKAGLHIGDMQTNTTTFMNWCPHVMDGTKLVRWIVETGRWPRNKPTVHSANPDGRKRMQGLIDQFFGQPAMGPMF